MQFHKYVMALSLLISVLLASGAAAGQVRLSAAASMTDAVKELMATYGREQPGVTILANFASSGSLAKQIAAGAPADLYISANRKWMDYLLEQGVIDRQSVAIFAHNRLVFIGPANDTVHELADLVTLERIALGSPGSVPAGHYAAQAMTAAGVYQELKQAHKLMLAKDVRQALIYAERGEVDGAFVYGTDARLARRAVSLFGVPGGLHDPISYPLALTVRGAENDEARALLDYLKGPVARAILKKYGFVTEASR